MGNQAGETPSNLENWKIGSVFIRIHDLARFALDCERDRDATGDGLIVDVNKRVAIPNPAKMVLHLVDDKLLRETTGHSDRPQLDRGKTQRTRDSHERAYSVN